METILHLFARAFFLHTGCDELVRRIMSRINGPFANATKEHRYAQVARVLPLKDATEATWLENGLESINANRQVHCVADDILSRCGLPFHNA